MGYQVGDFCKKCQKTFEDMTHPMGVPQSDHHRHLCIWCDLHYSDSFFVKCQIPVCLTEYFFNGRMGMEQKTPRLRVISAIGNLGTIEKVTWVPDPCKLFSDAGCVDEEKSVVHIVWDNGSHSDQPITELDEVIVQPLNENICAALCARTREHEQNVNH